jgi:dTMP kinase
LKRRGLLITLEGIDGSGKSTQLRRLANWLRRLGYRPQLTREPGGTRVGEQIRQILLASRNSELGAMTELLLMYAARQQHLEEIVCPALRRGEVVLSDRFNDASFAYQGYGRQLGEAPVRFLDRFVCGSLQPDLTLLFDLPAHVALARTSKRDQRGGHRRFESQGLGFHERVRRGYLRIAQRQPERMRVIDAGGSVQEVQAQIREAVGAFLARCAGPEGRRRKAEGGRQ